MSQKSEEERTRLRYNILTIFIYIVGIILLIQLFILQIIHGEEYRTQSNTRLTRESTLEAARGSILDRNGNAIAGTKMGFSLDLYRSQVDVDTLNNTLLKIIQVLQKNNDNYTDSFPISINPFTFTITDENKLKEWKKQNDMEEEKNAEDIFYYYKEKYKIKNENIEEVRKIIGLRYEITKNGYSAIRPYNIAKNISRETAIELSEQGAEYPGVNVVVQPVRDYINGSLACHVIGYIGRITEKELEIRKDTYENNDYIGKNGIEYVLEEYLKGKDGIKQIDMDVNGAITDEYIYKEAIAGSDVMLTIDANLQQVTETALKENIEKIRNGGFGKKYDAKGGTAIVMNVKTGDILALASYPDFEPQLFLNGISTEKWNEYNSENVKAMFNRATQGTYAPGSIFKMVTAIAGLETKNISRTEKILTKGKYPYAHHPVCWIYTDKRATHGLINVSQAIQYSCNYFFYEVGRRTGIEEIEKYAKYFGLGAKTGIELPNEVSGTLATKENLEKTGETWMLGNTLSAAIGQGQNNFSPLQIVRYVSMLANGGDRIQPTVIKTIMQPDGTEIPKEEIEKHIKEKLGITEPEYEDLDIDKKNLEAVLEGMRSVTGEADGTAYGAFSGFDIEVGGKTGSAETGNGTNAWFAGFAPFDSPEIAVVVLVENGSKGSYTASVARKIMDEYFGMNTKEVDEKADALPYTETNR